MPTFETSKVFSIECLLQDQQCSKSQQTTITPEVQTVFTKIPELYEDVLEDKVKLSNMELVALACSSSMHGLEVRTLDFS